MKNRNFGYLDADNRIVYAENFAEIDGMIYTSPTAEHYAKMNPPRLPIDSTKPEKVGVYFISTEYGDLVDGRIVRRYEERAITPPPVVYIVEEIIYQLIASGKLQATKSVVGDYWELLTMRERIDADNAYFAEFYPQFRAALVSQGVFDTEDEVDAMLAKCREGYMDDESGREVR